MVRFIAGAVLAALAFVTPALSQQKLPPGADPQNTMLIDTTQGRIVIKLRTDSEPLPSSRLRRVHVDCSSLGPRSIEMAVAMYGADRIVFGTDCPIFRTDWSLEAVHSANISQGDRDAILYRNAEALLASVI